MLELRELEVYYDKSYILQGLFLRVRPGEILSILGRNGVGKTTILRTIMGLVRPRSGTIIFDGREITRLAAYKIPRLGIGYVPQGRRIFPRLTTMENIMTAVVKGSVSQKSLEEIFGYFPRLEERRQQPGGTLSGGEQQMLAMARAMISEPKMLILDEPTEGIMPLLVQTIRQTITKLNREKGTTILLVEQNLDTALAVSHRLCVVEKGVVKYSDALEDLDKNKLVSYLVV
ncbi:MAG: ABC transporter ATP-binding protein [Thermodesulfobacteriota bacterium]